MYLNCKVMSWGTDAGLESDIIFLNLLEMHKDEAKQEQ